MRCLVLGCVLLLAACASTPLASDLIQVPAQAVAAGQKACAPKDTAQPSEIASWQNALRGDWHAEFRGGRWNVWLGGTFGKECPEIHIQVRANDGKPEACLECVVVT